MVVVVEGGGCFELEGLLEEADTTGPNADGCKGSVSWAFFSILVCIDESVSVLLFIALSCLLAANKDVMLSRASGLSLRAALRESNVS